MTDTCELPGCTRPPRDQAFVCDPCGDDFANDLKALVEWLDEELETSLAGTKGAKGPEFRGGKIASAAHFGLRINWRAAEIHRRLHRALSEAVDHCMAVKVRNQSTTQAEPSRTVRAMALWLTWRVDGLCLDKVGGGHIREISELVDRAEELVNWEPTPLGGFLGRCDLCEALEPSVLGHIFAQEGAVDGICNRCEAAFPAEARRAELVAKLDDRLATAADIADMSTYMGLHKDRDRVRKQANLWHHRKVIEAKAHNKDGDPMFRLGDVWRRLVKDDDVTKTTA